MRYLKQLVCVVALLAAQFAWAALPAFEGKVARIRVLEAKVSAAPAESGAKSVLRISYLVSRQDGVSGELALREPRDVLVGGRSYREITRAESARDFEPKTSVNDAAKFSREQPALWPEGVSADGAFVITVELFGSAIPAGAEVRSRLQVGFDKKIERGEFTFTPVSD